MSDPKARIITLLNTREDMDWLRDVHLPHISKIYKSALLYGLHEDSPTAIDLFKKKEPLLTDSFVTYVLREDGYRREGSGSII